jgi:hypothetical protein
MTTAKQVLTQKIRDNAVEFYRMTGKRLNVTGELGEHYAETSFNVVLSKSQIQKGYDGMRGSDRVQVKCTTNPKGRMSAIHPEKPCDVVMLIVLDPATLEPRAVWEAPFSRVIHHLPTKGEMWSKNFMIHASKTYDARDE